MTDQNPTPKYTAAVVRLEAENYRVDGEDTLLELVAILDAYAADLEAREQLQSYLAAARELWQHRTNRGAPVLQSRAES